MNVDEMHGHMLAIQASVDAIGECSRLGAYLITPDTLQAAVSKALRSHENGLTRHSGDTNTSTRIVELNMDPQYLHESVPEDEERRRIRPRRRNRGRSCTIYESNHKFWLFDDLVKSMERYSVPDRVPGETLFTWETPVTETIITYDIRIKIPCFARVFPFEIHRSSMTPLSGLIMHTTYNVIPSSAPILKTCWESDVKEARRLFDLGLASPFERDELGWTLLDQDLWNMYFSKEGRQRSATYEKAVELIAFLCDPLEALIGPSALRYSHLLYTSTIYGKMILGCVHPEHGPPLYVASWEPSPVNPRPASAASLLCKTPRTQR